MKKKLLLALIPLTVLMFFYSGIVYAVEKANEITFADPAVEKAVREGLKGKTDGPVYSDECELITWLRISGEGEVIDLSGLENLSRLNQLDFTNASVTDFSPLSGLTNLKGIIFYSSEIRSLASISALPHLESLSLRDCRFHEPSSMNMVSLTGLMDLYIIDSYINDISQLSLPTGLRFLHLQNNGISDIPRLSHITNLVSLDIMENEITDITPLAELNMLFYLNLAENQIRDIAPLTMLKLLGIVDLSGNHISTVDSLPSLSNLQRLDLRDNDIEDLTPLLEADIPKRTIVERSIKRQADGTESVIKTVYTMELDIEGNPLNEASIKYCIPRLEEKGVKVDY